MKPDRLVRVNRLLQAALAEALSRVKDPDVASVALLTITGVKTSPDLRHAKVFLSAAGDREDQEAARRGLDRARGFLRGALSKSGLRLRYLPELHFVLDETMESASRVEQILRELAREGEHRDQAQQQDGDAPRPEEQGDDVAAAAAGDDDVPLAERTATASDEVSAQRHTDGGADGDDVPLAERTATVSDEVSAQRRTDGGADGATGEPAGRPGE